MGGASADLLPTLKARTSEENGELLTSEVDALRAFEVITKRRLYVVARVRLFAATPRRAALINPHQGRPDAG